MDPSPDPLPTARQARPEVTIAVCRGACRLMRQAGHSVLLELPLPDGRRADIFAVGRGGELVIVEVKSSIEDWRVDGKWPDYLDWCDQLYVAVPVDFPQSLIPEETGLIVADAYGGEILRAPPRRPVAAARRKALLIDCARLASERLARIEDPDFGDMI
ncbi:MAG: MmcB family DNA repair protein [Reyranella sp.]|nr:MmcB family DNA repair protein [Reyranella sp.]